MESLLLEFNAVLILLYCEGSAMDIEVFVLKFPLVACFELIELLSHVLFETHLDIGHF